MTRFIARTAWGCLLLLAALSGCREVAFPPAGSYAEVDLVADGGRGGEWATTLVPLIEVERDYFVSTEPAFRVVSVAGEPSVDPPTVKNVVLCGVLDGSSAVGARITDLLGEAGVDRVLAGQAAILKKEDVPLPGQLTLIITAATEDALREVLKARGEEISEIIDASCRERLRRYMLQRRRAAQSEEFRRHWGFFIEVPTLYTLFREGENPPGVELHRESPPRVLGVFWKEWDHAPSLYNTDELFDFRADYVRRVYDGDQMERNRVRYAYTRLGEYTALRMNGYWYNDEFSMAGGYFETYFVWDKDAKLLWAVDCLVYAPGREKTSLVRELHALAETFRYQ
ncbi:MAG: DUF4837 family protein [Candidatus Krumholzibacteria bacterium]|nr:DUF4837 family protein [Candidatus Krumholzibacteria bacterium]MDH4337983.1 DUF4837 family protein [Candidatus Krumholzibacteria bacterium]MDH5268902.1 DUF4837 family protein [Candidatus Krumholzibacteria bacterium]